MYKNSMIDGLEIHISNSADEIKLRENIQSISNTMEALDWLYSWINRW